MKKFQILMILSTILLFACQKPGNYKSYKDYPVYDGDDLELTFTPEKSKFRVWAPTAVEVKVLLYEDGWEGSAYRVEDMKKSVKGTWTLSIHENLEGKFYTFQVRTKEKWLNETPGMWVKATGVNGKRAAIIDFEKTNPMGWDNDVRPTLKNFTDMVIYEVHVRDFSISPTSGMEHKGKFLSFTELATQNSTGESTGLEHLVDLGVTHVHLLPSYDYASVDETKLAENKYNWGYDPQNYNVPEGGYSTDPYNPVARIREFKQMVQSLHNVGIRVIMDVVYNHTFVGEESNLNQLAPNYFYRFKADNAWSNASGCGNETASDHAMMRKFIVESVVYWATEYKVDGFRFDLMGIHDIETMNDVRAALDKVDPTIYVYGEGWTADSSPLAEEFRAVKKNAQKLNNIGVFSDDLRDALKGSWMSHDKPGFASGMDSLEESVKFGIVGASFHPQVDYTKPIYSKEPYTNNPTQIINYVSCHDDMCLVDKLKQSKPEGTTPEELIRYNKLAQSVVFTSMGVPFIYAGEELYRDKKGVNNTYQSPDSINQIDWDNKTRYRDVYDYYKGLIALRKAHPAFRIATQKMMVEKLKFLDLGTPNVVAFQLGEYANGDTWKNILVLLNGNRKQVNVDIDALNWTVVAHDGKINLDGITTHKGGSFTIAPSSMSVLYVK